MPLKLPSYRRMAVYCCIRDAGGWISTPEIMEQTGVERGNVRHTINELLASGSVKEAKMHPAPKYRWVAPHEDLDDVDFEAVKEQEMRRRRPFGQPQPQPKISEALLEARRRGGHLGGTARARKLSKERRSEIARMGGEATREKYRRLREAAENQ